MKKLFTLAIAAGMAASMSMDAESIFRMTEFGEYNSLEIFQYEWNDANQIVRKNVESDDETYCLYVYNEQGLLALEQGYQYFYDEADPKKEPVPLCTYHVKMYYNEAGQMVERRVQNISINTGEVLSDAAILYEYNSDGKMAQEFQYFLNKEDLKDGRPEHFVPGEGRYPFETVTYSYNDLGQLIEENSTSYKGNWNEERGVMVYTDEVQSTVVYSYFYDGKGRQCVMKSSQDNRAGATAVYVYDKEGACTEYFETNSQFRFEINADGDMEIMNEGTISRRLIFTCSDVPASDCLYPSTTFDMNYGSVFAHLTNQLESIDEFRLGDDDVLHEWGTWDVEWQEVDVNGIEGISADAAQVDFSINGNVMTINGLDRNASVNIFDMNGRLVQASKGATVFLGHLNEGVYVIATPAGNAKIVR